LLAVFARRQGFAISGAGLKPVAKLLLAGALLAAALYFGERYLQEALAGLVYFREESALAVLVVAGGLIYAALVLVLLGRGWLGGLFKDVGSAADKPPMPPPPPDPTTASSALPDNTPTPNV
jgi:putative peptidoglycan lipid II flippase